MAAKYSKGAIPYEFVPVPKQVLRDPQYAALSSSAKALMLDLAVQYTGKNNGRLCPSFAVMQRCGWTSINTLLRAKRDLLECGWVMQTRIGHPPRTAEWLGFTWWRLDWEKSMEVSPQGWPYLNFALPVLPKRHPSGLKTAPGTAKTAPIAAQPGPSSVPKQQYATEVRPEKVIGAETALVLDVAISAPLSPDPLLLLDGMATPGLSLIDIAKARAARNAA
jgi:hypothetical protein